MFMVVLKAEGVLGALQRGWQGRVARTRRERGDQYAADIAEELQRFPLGPEAQPERHRAEKVEEHHREAPEGKDAEGDQDIQADLDDHTIDHQRHRVGCELQRDLHDTSHEFGD